MKMLFFGLAWTLMFFVGAALIPAMSASGENLTREQIEYAEKVIKDRKEELGDELVFHGRVVDFDGNPVAGARVEMDVMFVPVSPFDLREFRQIAGVTDEDGRFSVREAGFGLSVKDIVRQGYVYNFKYSKDFSFMFKKGKEKEGRGEQKDKPFTFRIRKLGPPAFVVIHNMTFGLKPGTSTELDLIRREWVEPYRLFTHKMMFPDWHGDIRLSVEGEPGKMRLILEAPDPDSGFVVEKHEFFEQMTEAPEHGYRQKIDIPVASIESPVTAYVKCQGGLFYAKIDISFSEDRPGVVGINATSFTNLAKGRGLEYIPSVESQYDREVYSDHTRQLVRRADLLSGQPIEMPKVKGKD
ncbi:MAG: hypothetical protein NDI73_07185 [Desulfuromonadales bacterium]|nr:hypothetical protein [Desulfuromonadales bacterium]